LLEVETAAGNVRAYVHIYSVLHKQPLVSGWKYENRRRDIWSETHRLCPHFEPCKLITTINWDLAIFLD